MNNVLELYSDGSCINNPGPGGTGYILKYIDNSESPAKETLIERSRGYKLTTNNRMEILGCIGAIDESIMNIKNGTFTNVNEMLLFTDSKYFCDAVNRKWIDKWQGNGWVTSTYQSVKNKDLWENILEILKVLGTMGITLNIQHIPGHQGHVYNEKCDKLANDAARGTDLISDEVYEKTNRR